jgi:hypothetical protein
MRFALSLALTFVAAPAMADIVPRDGTWTSQMIDGEIDERCAPAARAMLEPMLAAMADSSQETELEWGGEFDPATAMGVDRSDDDSVTWTRLDANTWESTVTMNPDDPRPAVTLTFEATSPERIEGVMTMDFEMMTDGTPTDREGNPVDASNCVITGQSAMTWNG